MWSSLSGVVVGAVLALLAQVLIQLVIVPSVESRKRREERWEKNVIELGTLLVTDLPPILGEFRAALQLSSMASARPNLSQDRRDVIEERLQSAYLALDSLDESKVHWLMRRVTSLAPDSKELKAFDQTCFLLHADLSIILSSRYADSPQSVESIREELKRCDERRTAVIAILEDLADLHYPPRPSSKLGHLSTTLLRYAARNRGTV